MMNAFKRILFIDERLRAVNQPTVSRASGQMNGEAYLQEVKILVIGPGMNDKFTAMECCAFDGWPAETVQQIGPWLVRHDYGVTARANSVFTPQTIQSHSRSSDNTDLQGWIAQAEEFYRLRNSPPIFQISPAAVPPELDSILEARGYRKDRFSEYWLAEAAKVAACPISLKAAGKESVSDLPDEAWLACAFGTNTPDARIEANICRRISVPRRFASILIDGKAIACGLATISRSRAAVHCMATNPAWRRRGFAAQVLRILARWAVDGGAQQFLLQVMSHNAGAKELYARAGFVYSHSYHYRVLSK